VLTSKSPNAENFGRLNACRINKPAIPTTFTPGINVVGGVLSKTFLESLVRPSITCTEFLFLLMVELRLMFSVVKFTTTMMLGYESSDSGQLKVTASVVMLNSSEERILILPGMARHGSMPKTLQ